MTSTPTPPPRTSGHSSTSLAFHLLLLVLTTTTTTLILLPPPTAEARSLLSEGGSLERPLVLQQRHQQLPPRRDLAAEVVNANTNVNADPDYYVFLRRLLALVDDYMITRARATAVSGDKRSPWLLQDDDDEGEVVLLPASSGLGLTKGSRGLRWVICRPRLVSAVPVEGPASTRKVPGRPSSGTAKKNK
ncbi:uncharacterized protein LOC143276306 [Babylonia areolata]|uniref:uncharacterized protein LOC143276306 n=1 Tax=Babylonia areolata TaxID=304850 RepID=UPI003FD562FF